MLNGIHFLLTYTCNFECDHCFLYCSPRASGTFTIGQVRQVLDEAEKLGTVEWIYFEGGEPFLYFPLLVEAVRDARGRGFLVGMVTNAYGARSAEDAELWLRPLAEAGLSYLSVSNDEFHYGDMPVNPATTASEVAGRLGVSTAPICIESPRVQETSEGSATPGEPVVGGGAKFRGRAADKLTEGLPRRRWEELDACLHEELRAPSRVHVDALGHVHICQGISMGNLWETPLSELVSRYRPDEHPICGPLLAGGPAELVRREDLPHADGYVVECHLCYLARRELVSRYPDLLAPGLVYGLEDE